MSVDLTLRSADRPATRLATRLSFLVAGFGMASWAPLVPFVQQRLGVGDATLGLLLLCLGIGSVTALLAAGPLISRHGSRPMIIAGGAGLGVCLPLLALAASPIALGTALLLFGASLGSLDVAMNAHAVAVERDAGRPLMSGFHALFSIGGFAGSALITALLSAGVGGVAGTLLAALLIFAALCVAARRLLPAGGEERGSLVVLPRGVVLVLALLAAATFLTEGAMLDWGALLITDRALAPRTQSGLGYILFSIAMTIGRLVGDSITARIGDRRTLLGGGMLAVLGFVLLLLLPVPMLALAGFLLIGFGAANIVPVLFRRAGTQTAMPVASAIAAISLVGYAGILAGPAAIGFVAHATSIANAFWMLAALMASVPLLAGVVARRGD